MRQNLPREDMLYSCEFLPILGQWRELKTKPKQHSVRECAAFASPAFVITAPIIVSKDTRKMLCSVMSNKMRLSLVTTACCMCPLALEDAGLGNYLVASAAPRSALTLDDGVRGDSLRAKRKRR